MSEYGAVLYRLGFVIAVCLMTAACMRSPNPAPPQQMTSPAQPVVAAPSFGPVILENGQCSEVLSIDLNALKTRQSDESLQGLNECELVALKGVPLSVQTGSSSNSRRETTMLYMEPTGKAVYLFSDNKLARVIRAGQQ